MSSGDLPRVPPLWPLLVLLILLGLLGGVGVEVYQQRRFSQLEEQIALLSTGFEDLHVVRDKKGSLRIEPGKAVEGVGFSAGTGADTENNPRWIWFTVQAKSGLPLPDWAPGSFILQLSQRRSVLLRSPKVLLIPMQPMAPGVAAFVDTLLKSHGIATTTGAMGD
ncbi:MAG TPA: hypothetical protein VE981_17285 [Planctomycetota bacterium]|nr:hypothetical protein [Planctomycetota bacterium]